MHGVQTGYRPRVTPTVGLEPMTTRLRALRSADGASRAIIQTRDTKQTKNHRYGSDEQHKDGTHRKKDRKLAVCEQAGKQANKQTNKQEDN